MTATKTEPMPETTNVPLNPPPYDGPPGPYHGPPPGPPGHYGPPPTQVAATVIVQPGPGMVMSTVGREPTHSVCKSCHQQILTRVEYTNTTRTHVIAALLCLFICWPCACLPYCMDSCKNADHYCPNCGAYIGTYIN